MKEQTSINPAFFQPSGLNDKFHGDGLSFDEYIKQTQQMIAQARVDLTPENSDTIIAANSPYEFFPSTSQAGRKKYKRAILVTHGLSDSPFMLKDMAHALAQHGFLVRGILLPGHGTVPADLLNVQYEEWERCINYGIHSLKEVADEIYAMGFSTGGALSILHNLTHTDLAGLILVAPALAFTTPLIPFYTHFFQYMQYFSNAFKWFPKQHQTDYAKYETFTVNAAAQVMHLMKKTCQTIQKSSIHIPMFIVTSANDEVISPKAAFNFFNKNKHPKREMLIYGNQFKYLEKFEHVKVRDSVVPEQGIVNFSHICLGVSPNNPYYGINGSYKDFSHYSHRIPPHSSLPEKIFLGAPTQRIVRKYILQRLRYNPDFNGMMAEIFAFLDSLTVTN
jgi:esterase/lipase